ncbi:MerR family transcriptional regulator [Pseudonocardia humida]|uniref:MerR family transcriptional regulator n=1 Tax=Pseudonocardia humida TaxID=2800819 RepID=A0ABT1ABE3_9PSEU|nr:MerR family transcriptional regulator [Pseudonocardia humida]MCO1659959.1 MerR family transcriptional regulator [Pseudonocardia humida]
MRSGQLAAAAGVNVQTLRYYERRGLLPEPRRTLGGYREYDDDAVALLRVVKSAQRLGFTLDEVTELLDAGRRRHPTPDLQQRARAKLAEVEDRMADLARIRDGLLQVVRARCDSLTNCTCPDCPLPFVEPAEVRPFPASGESP